MLGHTLELIQGPQTCKAAVQTLMDAIRRGEPVSVPMINHTRTGKPFSHTLRVEPLRDSRGRVQCFQATSSNIDENPILPATDDEQGEGTSAMLEASFQSSTSDSSNAGEEVRSLHAMLRTPSELALGSMLPRSGSELQISEMLDLFDQDALKSSPGLMPSSPRRMPTPHSLPTARPSSAQSGLPAQPTPPPPPDLRAIPPIGPLPTSITAIPEATREEIGDDDDDDLAAPEGAGGGGAPLSETITMPV